jgi:hypothetical protein
MRIELGHCNHKETYIGYMSNHRRPNDISKLNHFNHSICI